MSKTIFAPLVSLSFLLCASASVYAEVNFDVNARLPVTVLSGQPPPAIVDPELAPPVVVMQKPPRLIYSSELGYYVAVDTPYEMVYIDNSYYVHRHGRWFVSSVYNAAWIAVELQSFPDRLRRYDWAQIRRYRDHEYDVYRRDPGHYQGRFYDYRAPEHHAAPHTGQRALAPREGHAVTRGEHHEAVNPAANRHVPPTTAPRVAVAHGEVPRLGAGPQSLTGTGHRASAEPLRAIPGAGPRSLPVSGLATPSAVPRAVGAGAGPRAMPRAGQQAGVRSEPRDAATRATKPSPAEYNPSGTVHRPSATAAKSSSNKAATLGPKASAASYNPVASASKVSTSSKSSTPVSKASYKPSESVPKVSATSYRPPAPKPKAPAAAPKPAPKTDPNRKTNGS